MKRLACWLGVVSLLVIGCLGMFDWTHPAMAGGLSQQQIALAENQLPADEPDELNAGRAVGNRIDLNNSNVRAFSKYPGLYPTLARIIVGHAPYEAVEDVLDIPGLSDRQIDTLQANLDKFVASDINAYMIEGGDRYNNGIYK